MDGASCLPLGKAILQPACPEPELAELRHGFERQHAVGPTAVQVAKSHGAIEVSDSTATDVRTDPRDAWVMVKLKFEGS